MIYLLDTNALTALMRGHRAVRARIRDVAVSDIVLSSIVMHEYYYGAFHGSRTDETIARAQELPFVRLDFTDADARCACQIRAALRSRGAPIGPYDVLIAGQALARGLILVTNNVSEFSRVEGLRVEDWQG
ncbi:pilus assembly protein [Bosea sp. AAP35]|uniref:type II toxin-antitoxin system VapC family toxin n=1 Tax=Bosea sp. AAP35 TaxID=1523417 RepID=UPI0006B92314|nr:type II toxin-antitoxin system VapC family toxin [Bosea sp. AAP35]KPF64598.1 pilus assembly protein [Bosea sp. AAP35]